MLDDPDKVIDTMFLMLTYSDAIYKEIILWKEEDKIAELLNVLRGKQSNLCYK